MLQLPISSRADFQLGVGGRSSTQNMKQSREDLASGSFECLIWSSHPGASPHMTSGYEASSAHGHIRKSCSVMKSRAGSLLRHELIDATPYGPQLIQLSEARSRTACRSSITILLH
jgi:hypothetical protein